MIPGAFVLMLLGLAISSRPPLVSEEYQRLCSFVGGLLMGAGFTLVVVA